MNYWCAALIAALAFSPASAEQPQSGARQVPARAIPVPATVSPQMQALIAGPLNPIWNVVPRTAAEWKALVAKNAADAIKAIPALRDALHVKIEPATIGGVKAYILTPDTVLPANRGRLL